MPKSKNPLLDSRSTSSSSPFSPYPRQKPNSSTSRPKSKAQDDPLPDTGRILSFAPSHSSSTRSVPSLILHIRSTTFAPVPDRGAGMSSTRVAEILRFRASLPPIVTLGHMLTVCSSATAGEREVAKLVGKGEVRRVNIIGRGGGVGEGVVLASEWRGRIEEGLSDEDMEGIKQRFLNVLLEWRGFGTLDVSSLAEGDVKELVAMGFLTNPHALMTNSSDTFVRSSNGNLALSGSRAATGSLAAVGGAAAVHDNGGGGGSALASRDRRPSALDKKSMQHQMTPSLPSTGSFISFVSSARVHLMHLLKLLSPAYRETTYEILRDKWDGNIPGSGAASEQKQARGEFRGVLPGKTKKWKDFHGMRFEWILEECVGAGLCEIFETGIGIWGVRGL